MWKPLRRYFFLIQVEGGVTPFLMERQAKRKCPDISRKEKGKLLLISHKARISGGISPIPQLTSVSNAGFQMTLTGHSPC